VVVVAVAEADEVLDPPISNALPMLRIWERENRLVVAVGAVAPGFVELAEQRGFCAVGGVTTGLFDSRGSAAWGAVYWRERWRSRRATRWWKPAALAP
jgi:hypothetical protein